MFVKLDHFPNKIGVNIKKKFDTATYKVAPYLLVINVVKNR